MKILTERRFEELIGQKLSERDRELWMERRLEEVDRQINELAIEVHKLKVEIEGGTPVCNCATTVNGSVAV